MLHEPHCLRARSRVSASDLLPRRDVQQNLVGEDQVRCVSEQRREPLASQRTGLLAINEDIVESVPATQLVCQFAPKRSDCAALDLTAARGVQPFAREDRYAHRARVSQAVQLGRYPRSVTIDR